jgi:predicted ATPase
MAEMARGLGAYATTGSQLAQPVNLARMAELHLVAGRQEEGLGWIEDSLACEEEAWWLPEQFRLHAELLLLTPGNEAEAEAQLWRAVEVTRSQNSKSLELRAVMSLARLLRDEGRAAEGRDLLAECYGWFSEGFDTADLQDAGALLDALERDAEAGSTVKEKSLAWKSDY